MEEKYTAMTGKEYALYRPEEIKKLQSKNWMRAGMQTKWKV